MRLRAPTSNFMDENFFGWHSARSVFLFLSLGLAQTFLILENRHVEIYAYYWVAVIFNACISFWIFIDWHYYGWELSPHQSQLCVWVCGKVVSWDMIPYGTNLCNPHENNNKDAKMCTVASYHWHRFEFIAVFVLI